ncbi:LysR family transcriptional regulator [Boseongicola aestuarii]|nr:LysR substrate-binding domain-containing protein [Boseongicola aestuarii]
MENFAISEIVPVMSIKIEMLRCFVTVVAQGSLAEAANALGRTASAVSMMLKQLEDHIGAPLFETARKSRLTPLGRQVLDEARREIEHFDRTVAAIDGLAKAERGQVRLAVTPSIAQSILPPILRRYVQAHPDVRIDIRDADSAQIEQDIRSEAADIGISSLGPVEGYECTKLFSDRFGVICRGDHRLARDWDRLTWADLEGETFIANGLCSQIKDERFRPVLARSRLMVRNTTSLLGLVRAGVGVTVVPRLVVEGVLGDLVFLPLQDTSAKRDVWMITQPRHLLGPAAGAMVAEIQATEFPKSPPQTSSWLK